jgi:hypothetical protein
VGGGVWTDTILTAVPGTACLWALYLFLPELPSVEADTLEPGDAWALKGNQVRKT